MTVDASIHSDGFSTIYISCGCNSFSQAMDWGENNLICFATCNSVAVCEPYLENGGKVIATCTRHRDKVNCVKWIRGRDVVNEFVSCSFDNTGIVWLVKSRENIVPLCTLVGHTSSIHSVDGIYGQQNTIVVTAAADYTVILWRRDYGRDEFINFKVLSFSPSFVLSVNLLKISQGDEILLALGMDSARLELYAVHLDVEYLTRCDGHEDWIRSIDMKELQNGDILIATSSQDMSARVIKLSQEKIKESNNFFHNEKLIIIKNLTYYFSVETILYGHEGWVLSVHWVPGPCVKLLTSSFDRTLVIWSPDPETGLWMEEARMGELGGDNSIGYFGARFAPDGQAVLAHSYQGSFQYWKLVHDNWNASFIIGGHSDGVVDIDWEKTGSYLLSVSLDKTTRLHSPQMNNSETTWYEMSRPQIHGHSFNSIAALNNYTFASCAEEKVVRVFQPTNIVLKILRDFSKIEINEDLNTLSSASIPALGLSNKAGSKTAETGDVVIPPSPPNEDYLIQNTLWPEIMKLYGHGYEVFSVGASNDGTKLATACKSTTSEHAQLILWNTKTWDIIDKLAGHQLTVTQISFSPDDIKLLTVSRDRKWCLYQSNDAGSYSFICCSGKTKISHSRIIWTCSWSHDSSYFATGSRDSKVIIWKDNNPVSLYNSSHGPVTALDFAKCFLKYPSYLIAIGCENGQLSLFSWRFDSNVENSWVLLYAVPQLQGHCLTIQRLRFRPSILCAADNKTDAIIQLASCSLDNSVRIFDINLAAFTKRLNSQNLT